MDVLFHFLHFCSRLWYVFGSYNLKITHLLYMFGDNCAANENHIALNDQPIQTRQ